MKKNRNKYGGIELSSLNPQTKKKVINLIKNVQKSKKVDEHGGWNFGADFDNKGRGSALNWELYDFRYDYHNKKFLALIQVRQYVKHKRDYYPQIRKNYYLLGKNEDESVFAHCVESNVIHNSIKKGKDLIYQVQNWIFGADYKKIHRHGDIGFLKVKSRKGIVCDDKVIILRESHEINAEEIYKDKDTYYVLNPNIVHLNNVHPSLILDGWYKVIKGKRKNYWSFAAPTID